MKRKCIFVLTFVLALALAAVLLPVPSSRAQMQHAWAQQGCKAFHGIVQGSLPTPNQFAATDTWGGPVHVNLGGEILIGGVSGNDGTQFGEGAVSIFRGGVYKVCFGSNPVKWGGPSDCYDSFIYKVPSAFVIWPGANSLGSYKAAANIVQGTGRFASASGYLDIAGLFIFWPDATSPFTVSGRWNGEFSGNICGVH